MSNISVNSQSVRNVNSVNAAKVTHSVAHAVKNAAEEIAKAVTLPNDQATFSAKPGGCCLKCPSLFNRTEDLIDDALAASEGKFGSEAKALNAFHAELKGMNQNQLDELKDTLVGRMADKTSSEADRRLLQKLYEITDAVAEHRTPPHLGKPVLWDGLHKPFPLPDKWHGLEKPFYKDGLQQFFESKHKVG